MARLSELQSRWEDYRPTKLGAFWICVAAVLATLIGGFGIGGWMTATKAEQMALEAADNARRELAVAVCVDEFLHSARAGERLAKLKSAEFFERSTLVAKEGYATMPDRQEPDTFVAARCAAALEEAKPAAPAKASGT